jgi:hypothetical protein
VQSFECEGRAGTVAEETLDPDSVVGLDAHGSVDAEAAGALPGEHAGGVSLVEECVATEVAEGASLRGGFELAYVIGGQLVGLVKLDLAVAGLAEDTVEDDEMIVRVDVEGGAEAVGQEGLQVVLDDLVQGRLGRAARSADGPG